jgi:ABC-2 type transport system permease protein
MVRQGKHKEARMSNSWLARYLTATRYAILEQVRNRFALILLLLFVPVWYYVTGVLIDNTLVDFKFRATGNLLSVNGHNLILLTAGLNAITLISGFMLFNSTRKDKSFDRRLVISGYPQALLMLAKLTALLITAAAIALYASVMLYFFWQPESLPIVWLGFFGATLIYGSLGLLLGVLLPGELEGFFLIIMVSLMDTFLQNPVDNPVANQSFLIGFPSYAPTQLLVAGGFTSTMPWEMVVYSAGWVLGFALLGLAIFLWKTRATSVHTTKLSAAAKTAP